ncbi:thioesterase family protein [Lishizhenia sp.]|uniref:acyl-CoA thioesterase n=1 Tax=Lishizhenia sp. TaxID=2497594 RepID=UPI00299DBACE|nr:thioesterase family protein [Lishizhenia sp.]MDX1446555.1 thioesterase family protein [Lishizhenia sp.]
MNYDFEHSTSLRVRYGETDQMGYCYYGNYAQYFEVGRVETLRAIGMSYKRMEEEHVMLPVSEYNVKYIRPALYDDKLTIITKIARVEGSRIYFNYAIQNEEGKVLSKASTTLVFVNKVNMRPIQPPAAFLEAIAPYQEKEDEK